MPSDAAQPGDELPSMDDMRDTLMFMWGYFFDEMIDCWLKNPGEELHTEFNGASIRMRHRVIASPKGGSGSDFVELTIQAQDESFAARGTFLCERGTDQPQAPVTWSSEGDHEEFVAWMVPWVSKHVAEGGGWIDLP
ncbi:MAG TPA: hypothetical protein VKA18_13245 [Alphaproteobacteria bacterium]|nr:hypothetical protein [Alphaproteobacteria bacterium]